jgi:hypothetical protein
VTIRPITHYDVALMAREQAEAGEPMRHNFDAGSREAAIFERAYVARQRELEEHEG